MTNDFIRISQEEFEQYLRELDLTLDKCPSKTFGNTSGHGDDHSKGVAPWYMINYARHSQLTLYEDDAVIELKSHVWRTLRNRLAHNQEMTETEYEIVGEAVKMWRKRLKLAQPKSQTTQPSQTGLYVLELVCSRENRDAIAGDLLEDFGRIEKEHGTRKARIWFWCQVTRSVFHLAWPALKRLGLVSGCLAGAQWVLKKFN